MVSYQSALKKSRKGPGVSAAFLKLLALVTMTIDHFAVVIIRNGKLYGYSQEYYQMAIATETGQRWLKLYTLCRYVGRLSFPIFAFLLVEGFIHTSDFWKYFRRVLIMALLAEVPYDLCFYNETYNFTAQNTGFTLAAALLVMYFMKRWRSHVELKWLSVIAGCAIAEYLHFDYGSLAILMIALMYNFRKEKNLSMLSLAVDIGFIQTGQTAEVKVETFNFQKYGMVNATVDEISPDAGSNPQDKETYQKYRLTLGLENDTSGIELTPGMNVSAEIKIKKKRIVDFFLDPFRQYQDEALRER